METIKGRVTQVLFDVEIENTTDEYGTDYYRRTWDLIKFELDGKQMVYKALQRVEDINVGDELVVAGKPSRELFIVIAYRNLTTGTASHRQLSPVVRVTAGFLILLGVLGIAAGVWAPWKSIRLVFAASGGTLFISGLYLLYVDQKLRKGITAIYNYR
ncbi:MAG: hypothetical protein M3R69_07830 [Acidobacteriota bacterium]|nr:hypothetical protein [Acidobacteriota bacterium]